MQYRIKVTQEHIDKGKRKRSCECPITLAVKEITGFKYVSTSSLIRIFPDGHLIYDMQIASVPYNAKLFIERFDNAGPKFVTPFEFNLVIN